MSEFHPNRQKNVRTKPALTMRRILECWPLLVWLGMLFLAWTMYASGASFKRMNGAVDVYQENVTPINDGRVQDIKVHRGQRVKAGDVVAIMDASHYISDLEGLKRNVAADRLKETRDLTGDVIKLESELRKIQRDNAEDSVSIREEEKVMENFESYIQKLKISPMQLNKETGGNYNKTKLSLEQAKSRKKINEEQEASILRETARLREAIAKLESESKSVAGEDLMKGPVTEIIGKGILQENEQQRFLELRTKIDLCELQATHGGTIDRIGKEPGEYAKAGESVLKIVGDPKQLVCFLPQDQADNYQPGTTLFVASTSNRRDYYQAKVLELSPRINNLQDSTSPLPNQRVHGRDVVLEYPEACRPKAPGDAYLLLPGQTLIIHTSKPGDLGVAGWFNKIFHNDDAKE